MEFLRFQIHRSFKADVLECKVKEEIRIVLRILEMICKWCGFMLMTVLLVNDNLNISITIFLFFSQEKKPH